MPIFALGVVCLRLRMPKIKSVTYTRISSALFVKRAYA